MSQQSFDDFAQAYAAGKPALVSETLVADLETPVSAFLKLTAKRRGNVFLLESVEGGATRGRYSMIGMDPDIIWRAQGDRCEINRNALADPYSFEDCGVKPLDGLRALIAESAIPADASLPPMAAGVFGYLGYDMVRQMEELAAPKPDPIGVPDAVMIRPTVMVVFDAVRDELNVVTPVRPRQNVSARAAGRARRRASTRSLQRSKARLCTPLPPPIRICLPQLRFPTRAKRVSLKWSTRPRNTSAPATSFRSFSRSVSPQSSIFQRLRSIAPCAV